MPGQGEVASLRVVDLEDAGIVVGLKIAGQRLRRRVDRGHPLDVAVAYQPTAAVGVLVLEDAVKHVGDGLEPAVRVPRGPLGSPGA
jgi:hypothetical protein